MASLYYNASVDTDYNNVLNWWTDVGYTLPAGIIPVDGDDVFIDADIMTPPTIPVVLHNVTIGSINTFGFGVNITGVTATGLIDFQNVSFNTGLLGDGVLFSGSGSYNNGGTVGDNAIFSGSYCVNNGTVGNNALFSGDSFTNDYGIVGDNAIFSGYGSINGGGIVGNNAVFSGYVGENNNGGIVGNNATFSGDYSYNNSIVGDNATFSSNSVNDGTLGDNATFTDNSVNNGTTGTNTTFNDASNNSGFTGNNTLFNGGNANNTGTAGDNTIFNSSSYNYLGTTGTNTTFNDSSINEGTTGDNTTFNNNSYNTGTTGTNTTFKDHSYNSGTVNGDAFVYCPVTMPLGGTVTGTITYIVCPSDYVTPLSGYKFITPFTMVLPTVSATDISINWGDGNFSNSSNAMHIYSASNIYTIYAGNCSAISAFSLSVYDGDFFNNKIMIQYDNLSAIASCPTTFTMYISSVEEFSTVFLYSSGSNAYPYNSDREFWSHLNPEWSFSDINGNKITQLEVSGSPVYDINSNLLGYSALSSVIYVDDMPGSPVLFFTLLQKECDVPINSRSYAALNYIVTPDVPARLLITADGVNQMNGIQWAGINIPYTVSVQGLCACNTIMHYASGYFLQNRGNQLCYGVGATSYSFTTSAIFLTDEDCFSTGGYAINTFILPESAIPKSTYLNDNNEFDCVTKTPNEIEFYLTRNAPYIQLSASALITVNNTNYILSGLSNPFHIYRLENFHNFYRKGEDKNPYQFIKQYSHFDFDVVPNFNAYLSAIAGPGDSLGKSYNKIINLNKDIADIDICNIDSIGDIAQKMDVELDDFELNYPEELKRLMHFFSIPLEKLVGTRCACNMQFSCEGCCGKNICSTCGYDKKNNLGDQLLTSDYVTAGQTILIKENAGTVFEFLPIVQTSLVRDITAVDINDYCFYKWNDFHQSNPYGGIIDYKNPSTTLSKAISSSDDWYKDNGIIEEMLNYTLTKNLLNN